VDYKLGREFRNLDARGTADIFSLFGAYPLVRSRDTNLYALGSLDAKLLEDKLGITDSRTNRNTKSATIGLRGDHHDSSGWNVFSVGATAGSLDIETPSLRAEDAATAERQGGFGKLQFSAARLQSVTGPLSLYAAVRGQLAANNLDSSEQMALGGPFGVRAYPEGETYGDQGYLATLEARLAMPGFASVLPGRMQLVGFVDAGAVTFNKEPWFDGKNSARRSGYGAGLIWESPDNFNVTASYARKLGDQEATSAPDRDGRFWLQLVKLF
jgi:hemolysin activation/secretion protein